MKSDLFRLCFLLFFLAYFRAVASFEIGSKYVFDYKSTTRVTPPQNRPNVTHFFQADIHIQPLRLTKSKILLNRLEVIWKKIDFC